jgi:murein L,D-transpeptidase YcbB/YkuD
MGKMRNYWIFFMLLFVFLGTGRLPQVMAATAEPRGQGLFAELKQEMQAAGKSNNLCLNGVTFGSGDLLDKFYQGRSYVPVWLDHTTELANAWAFWGLLENAADEGLHPEDYHTAEIKALLRQLTGRKPGDVPAWVPQAARLELLLSDAFFTFNTHIAVGRAPLEVRDGGIYNARQALHLDELLMRALAQDQALEITRDWVRTDALYLGLKNALQQYRELAGRHDWPVIPEGVELKLGEHDSLRIPPLQEKLSQLGDYRGLTQGEPIWDASLQTALMRFQSRHQLAATGRLNPDTLKALNRPLEEVVLQLEINLERWRWLPRDLGSKYILVNIPSYQLVVKENGRDLLGMKVVVGKQLHHTPVFASKVVSVVINPSWMIPTQIILKEKLRAIRHNPDFFQRNHILVIAGWGENAQTIDPASVDWRNVIRRDYYAYYRFQQEPGPWNALGRIKFILPNPYDIYLHGTPQQGLFGEPVRIFSHGCIRLEKPLALAEYVLDDVYNWSQDALAESVREEYEQTVDLPRPIPIYVTYMTSAFEGDGLLHFYPDIYNQDKDLIAAWERPVQTSCLPQGM